MQLCRIIYFSLAALHVSSDIFVHHQEHLNCITVCGITHVCRCRLVSWKYIYFFLAVLHVSSDIFARHQEHLNCITASGIIIIIIIIISVMELGHLLTRSGLTCPVVSSKVCHDSFCQLGNSVSLPWVPSCRLVSWECWNTPMISAGSDICV